MTHSFKIFAQIILIELIMYISSSITYLAQPDQYNICIYETMIVFLSFHQWYHSYSNPTNITIAKHKITVLCNNVT